MLTILIRTADVALPSAPEVIRLLGLAHYLSGLILIYHLSSMISKVDHYILMVSHMQLPLVVRALVENDFIRSTGKFNI